MKLSLRCSETVEGEIIDLYTLSAPDHETELEQAVLQKANEKGYTFTKEDIACIEVAVYHVKVFVAGVSTGSIAVDINKDLDLLWVDCSVPDEEVLLNPDKVGQKIADWLGVDF